MARCVGLLVASRPEWRAHLGIPDAGVKSQLIKFSSCEYISIARLHHPHSLFLSYHLPPPLLPPSCLANQHGCVQCARFPSYRSVFRSKASPGSFRLTILSGGNREVKKAVEAYWAGKISADELTKAAADVRKTSWTNLKERGVDLIPRYASFAIYSYLAYLTQLRPQR